MYARLGIVQVKPGKMEEAIEIARGYIPTYESKDGFLAYLLLSNPSSRENIGITVWESEEAAEAGSRFDESPIREAQERLEAADVLEGVPDVQGYEVRLMS